MRIKGLLACLVGALFALSCESSTSASQPRREARKTLDRSASPFALKLTGQPVLAQMGFGDAGSMHDHMGMDPSGMGMGGGGGTGFGGGGGTGFGGGGGTGFGGGGGTGLGLDAGLGGASAMGPLDGSVSMDDAGMELGFDAGGMTMR